MNEEELEEFLKKNNKVDLWSDKDIPEWTKKAESVLNAGSGEGFTLDYNDEKNGTKVESKLSEESGTMIVRSYIVLKNTSQKLVFDFLVDYDYAWEYDNLMEDFKILHMISPNQYINVYHAKSPFRWLISPRDFVYVSYRKPIEDGSYIVLLKGVEISDYPELKGVVRGWIYYTVYYVKPHPENKEDTLVLYMTNSDGKGSIPKRITNYLTRKLAPTFINRLRRYIAGYEEYLKKNPKNNEENEENVGEKED